MNLYVFKTWLSARVAPRSERGANLVEYLLLLAFIAIIVLGAVKFLGNKVSTKMDSAGSQL